MGALLICVIFSMPLLVMIVMATDILSNNDDSDINSHKMLQSGNTKYRTCTDEKGYNNYLEYLDNKKWRRIPQPYYDWLRGRNNRFGLYDDHLYIGSHNNDLDKFIIKYPNIVEYFKWYREKQNELEVKGRAEKQEFDNRKPIIKYFE